MEEIKKVFFKNNGQILEEYFICSEKHFDEINKYNWHKNSRGYPCVANYMGNKKLELHRFIVEFLECKRTPVGHFIDHKNGNRIDNRIENLRFLTIKQSSNNKLKYKNALTTLIGVQYKKKSTKKYVSVFRINGKDIRLGSYETEKEAAEAYDIYVYHNDLIKEGRKLNFEDNIEYYKTCRPFKHKKDVEYYGVRKCEKKYITLIKENDKPIFRFISPNPIECAKKYDEFVVKNGLKKSLNFIDDYPNYKPPEKIKHVKEYVDDKTFRFKIQDKYVYMSEESYDLIKYHTISISRSVNINIDNKIYMLRRFLLGENDTKVKIIHVDNDFLNNRLENLKRTNNKGNAQNVKKRKNSTSYLNVTKSNNGEKFRTMFNNTDIRYSKTHKTEEYAARDRDLQIMNRLPNSMYKLCFDDWNIPGKIKEWEAELFLEDLFD